jgi:hypothetical protein
MNGNFAFKQQTSSTFCVTVASAIASGLRQITIAVFVAVKMCNTLLAGNFQMTDA